MDREREREEQQRELRTLRTEIAALRRRLEHGHPAAALEPEPDRFCPEDPRAGAGGQEASRGLEARLGRVEAGISLLSGVTGVRIADFSMTRLELPGSGQSAHRGEHGLRILRKGYLAGECHTLPFQLEFQLLETQSEENSSVAITDLGIILEPMEYSELDRFVARTEEKRDLFLFFRSLHFFLEWCEYRQQTFQHFKEKHPAVVQLPGGPAADSMALQSPRVPGFELVVVWTVSIDEEGKVLPKLDLLTKIPEQALTLDEEVVARAPRCFRTLLPLLGIEAAIESLIQLLCTEE
ncbi:centromere protein P [Trichosurus vulpecula]|uniref:centromere protein P n=1 Tax=Trichosurus vulpecula TaxID=9337 RepID=UPI00186B4C00|nr:centromere protein P [Trichosurus vulpecula]